MKKNISSKIRLGIFISTGIAVFVLAIYFIGEQQQLFRRTFHLSGVFKDVGGLQAGNNVRLSGINVGTIENISFVSDTSVRVEIIVDENIRKFIKKDAVLSIGSEGLMGNKILIISPGTGKQMEIEDNDTIRTTPPINMDDILISLKTTMENTSSITGDLSKIINDVQIGKGTIGKLIVDKSMGQNIDSTFANLKEGSIGFKIFMDKAKDLEDILISLRSTIDNTTNITSDLSTITGNIQSGKGTIGMLLTDQSLGQNIDSTFLYLKEGSIKLNELIEEAKDSWLLWGF